jgi:hypothetical protein
MSASESSGSSQIDRRDSARHRRRTPWSNRTVADIHIKVDVDRPTACPRNLQSLSHHVIHCSHLQLSARDDCYARLDGALGVRKRVREWFNPDLHNTPTVKA